jgi:nucleotide-binding universal stress UspA family protein
MGLLERVVVPVADGRDAAATATALSQCLDEVRHVTVLHVVEKGGGVVDKAPMERRLTDATGFLSTVESGLGDEVTVETRVEFGTDVAETIVETALDAGATAIAFRPRGGSRLVRLLSGDTAIRLVTDAELPVVSLHPADGTRSSPERPPRAHGPGDDG